MVTNPKAFATLFPTSPTEYTSLGDETLDNTACTVFQAALPDRQRGIRTVFTFAVAKSDGLLRRVQLEVGNDKAGLKLTENYTAVTRDTDLPKEMFSFTPPEGFRYKPSTPVGVPATPPKKPAPKKPTGKKSTGKSTKPKGR
jgi:hypothetical protein